METAQRKDMNSVRKGLNIRIAYYVFNARDVFGNQSVHGIATAATDATNLDRGLETCAHRFTYSETELGQSCAEKRCIFNHSIVDTPFRHIVLREARNSEGFIRADLSSVCR